MKRIFSLKLVLPAAIWAAAISAPPRKALAEDICGISGADCRTSSTCAGYFHGDCIDWITITTAWFE